jgi:hypothetical protein
MQSRFICFQKAKHCSQLAGTPKDCILTELLRRRLKDDGATIEGEDDLKEAMATVYLGTWYYLILMTHC